MQHSALIEEVTKLSRPFTGADDLTGILEDISDDRYVLIGEASHGTHEFYAWRAELSKRLIVEKGFRFVGVEGDWPDCYRVNRYVKGFDDAGESAYAVLHEYNRWPTWMWANTDVEAFVEWLRAYNRELPMDERVGFYGLDVYSLWESMSSIIQYLQEHDPSAVEKAIAAYKCFEPYGEDVQEYARATALVPTSCEDEVIDLLVELRQKSPANESDGNEAHLSALQNTYVLHNAEAYYRTMMYGGPDSWNLRDTHMTETLERLMEFYGAGAKGIVWAHNTHIGDARYTNMAQIGEYNIGQLVRQRHEQEGVSLVGLGAYQGTVIAGRAWDAQMEEMPVPTAVDGSIEDILHRASARNQVLRFSASRDSAPGLLRPIGHRAIGVVYNPRNEFWNYVPSVMPKRYDSFIFFDNTRALEPMHMIEAQKNLIPETYPSAV